MAKASQSKIGALFHPLTEQQARDWYQRKHLSTTGYLLTIKGIIRPPGVNLIIPNVLAFCKEWGITKSAFYRAVNALKVSGEMDWEATEGIILKTGSSEKVVPLTPTSGTGFPRTGLDSHERDCDSHERDCDSHERDCDSHEREETYIKIARAQTIQTNTDFPDSLIPQEREQEEILEAEQSGALPEPLATIPDQSEPAGDEPTELGLAKCSASSSQHSPAFQKAREDAALFRNQEIEGTHDEATNTDSNMHACPADQLGGNRTNASDSYCPNDAPSGDICTGHGRGRVTDGVAIQQGGLSSLSAQALQIKPLLPEPRASVQSQGKPRMKPNSRFYSQQEMDDFYEVLKRLGKSMGISKPSAWAIAIIKGINDDGLPCEYLQEFRDGVPLGSREQEEWECEPGRPWPKFITFLVRRLKKTGMTEEEAISAAYSSLRDRNRAQELWNSCKREVQHLYDQWERDKALGVSNAYIPPELLPQQVPTCEQSMVAMQMLETHSAQTTATAALAPSSLRNTPSLLIAPTLALASDERSPDEKFQVLLSGMRSHIQSGQPARMAAAIRWAKQNPDHVRLIRNSAGEVIDVEEIEF